MYNDVFRFTRYLIIILYCYNISLVDIDIHQCLMEAVQRYQATPSSLCVRQYDVIPIQHSAIPQEAVKQLNVGACI